MATASNLAPLLAQSTARKYVLGCRCHSGCMPRAVLRSAGQSNHQRYTGGTCYGGTVGRAGPMGQMLVTGAGQGNPDANCAQCRSGRSPWFAQLPLRGPRHPNTQNSHRQACRRQRHCVPARGPWCRTNRHKETRVLFRAASIAVCLVVRRVRARTPGHSACFPSGSAS